MIIHLFILSSAVQMYEFSYIHCHNEISFAILCLLSFLFILFGTKVGGGLPQPLPLRGPCQNTLSAGYCLVPRPLAVFHLGQSDPFFSDTSPKQIHREGLGESRTGTRQGSIPCMSVRCVTFLLHVSLIRTEI